MKHLKQFQHTEYYVSVIIINIIIERVWITSFWTLVHIRRIPIKWKPTNEQFTRYIPINCGKLNCGKSTSSGRSFKFYYEEGLALIFNDIARK